MHISRHFRLIVPVLLLIVSLVAAPHPAAAFEQAVQPTSSLPGSVFAFFATGFEPEEWVYYWVNDPATGVHEGGAVRANHMGRADWTWKSPSDAAYGRWSMVALGTSSEQERVLFFEISDEIPGPTSQLPAGQQQYDVGVTPRSGSPGTDFDVFGRGFNEVERVWFYAIAPDGTMSRAGDFGTNENGRVDWTWESPPNALPGSWTLRMQGEVSHVERLVTVEIDPGTYPEIAPLRDTYDEAVTPRRGIPGTWFTFFMGNFNEYDTVSYQFLDPDGLVYKEGEAHANGNGRMDLELTMPPDAKTGIWSLVAIGRETPLPARTITFEVYLERDVEEVSQPGTAIYPYDKAVAPGEGTFGTTFSFFATGFEHEEPVDYDIIAPSGEVVHHASIRANERGRADWSWDATSIATPGVWTTVATGRDSGIKRSLQFTIR
jgi:hypothetical protein